ncbi:MAG: hypothetical protein JXC32_06510, partial [Anaerolineae bacterium]|nr:hypothetical protein [Anaerolineae bacterium]
MNHNGVGYRSICGGIPVRWGMTLVLLIAALLRLGGLPELPVGLHYDEAANLVLTREIVAGEYRPLFIRAYTGKEVLFFYAAAPWVWMTGGAHQTASAWGLRLGAAMLGVLTVAATFAATRALLRRHRGGPTIALIAAGWMAMAFPHVLLSRYGFRAISQPLLQALTVAALWRAMRSRRIGWSAAAGAFLGLTGYTYLAARLFPLPLALVGSWLLARSTLPERQRLLRRFAVVVGVAAIVFAPLGGYFLRHPDAFTTRIAQVAAPSWAEALRGIGLCLRALIVPGAGDSYIRFNVPGLAILDPISALLALLGVGAMVGSRRTDRLEVAGRVLVVISIFVMLLPSALATGEITPSNLRMVGLFPFLAILPAWGLYVVLFTAGRLRVELTGVRWRYLLQAALLVGLLIAGAVRTAETYVRWAGSDALFRATDGEMVVAAEALDAAFEAAEGVEAVTVYIASEHYRHPTVAALAKYYGRVKWLTGGASLVLPPDGDAVYVIPESLPPPALWPEVVTGAWTTRVYEGPDGTPALREHRLSASEIAQARDALLGGIVTSPADFAHVVLVHDARPAASCRAGGLCPAFVLWEPRGAYPALQPVVRLLHPEMGEWARTMAFHYP